MKTIKLSLLFCLSLVAGLSFGQDYNVTFRLDMQDYAGSFTTPEVNGSFNGWCGGCNALVNTGGTIWEGTFTIAAGSYDFKYAVDGWSDEETLVAGAGAPCFRQNGGFTNRTLDVTGDMTMDLVCWNSCYACVAGGTPGCTDASASNYDAAATANDGSCMYNLTFNLDMSQVTDPFTTPEVNGTFNGWCGGCNVLLDQGGGLWSATIPYQAGSYEYKFAADGWAIQENLAGAGACVVDNFGNVNRYVGLSGDMTLDLVCWNSCSECTSDIPGCMDMAAQNYNAAATIDDGSCQYLLTVTVDMSQQTSSGPVNSVFGSFNGWCPGCNFLTDNGDGTWSTTLTVANGTYEYKFFNDGVGALGEETFAGGESCTITTGAFTNRIVTVSGDTTVDVVCWQSCDACEAGVVPGCTDMAAQNFNAAATVDDGTCQYLLTVTVDMSQQASSGPINSVFGSFNGWCPGCNFLTDNGDGTWSTTLTVTNGTYEYKFFNDGVGALGEEIFAGGESCTITTGAFTNRIITVSGDTTVPVVCWQSCEECTSDVPGCTDMAAQNYNAAATIDDGTCQYLLTVTVNMSQVTDAFTTPEVNGTWNGWCGNCNALTDNGDGTWSGTVTVTNGMHQYKFSADAWNIEENLVGVEGCTVNDGTFWNRSVNVTGDTTIDVVCWGSCDDCAMEGCTNPLYLEFDPYAEVDNGTCITLVVEGCAYPDADNYDPMANRDDGSCMFTLGSTCPGDFNDDDAVTVADLTGFLGAFGTNCTD